MQLRGGGVHRLAATGLAALCFWVALPAFADDADLQRSEVVVWDPWEGMNRGLFWFNEKVDKFVAEPLGKGWAFIMPKPVRIGLRNVLDNTFVPGIMVNALFQGKPVAAAETFGRFMVNTGLGLGGFFDVASVYGEVPKHDEDFGQTFGYWGIPPGPYLVLPFLGPSNPRDFVGSVADRAATVWSFFAPIWVPFAVAAPDLFNRRSLLIKEIAAEREAAFDWYVAQRNAYTQYREARVRDGEPPEKSQRESDLYYFEDEAEVDEDEETQK